MYTIPQLHFSITVDNLQFILSYYYSQSLIPVVRHPMIIRQHQTRAIIYSAFLEYK